MDEQGDGADLLEPDPRRVAAAKERCDAVVRPLLTKTFDDTASSCPFASVGLEDSCSGEARGSSRGALDIECETFMTVFLQL